MGVRQGMARRLVRWINREGFLAGLLIGVSLALVGLQAWHEAAGLRRVSVWARSFDRRHHQRVREEMLRQVAACEAALEDGVPLELSADLVDGVMPEIYRHEMAYGLFLLRNQAVERFNEVRLASSGIVWDFSGADLEGMDLRAAFLSGSILKGARLVKADLAGANVSAAELSAADLSGARVEDASFERANLSGARLVGISGGLASFREASLGGANLSGTEELVAADLSRAVLDEAALIGTALPEAVLDGASLVGASLVRADLSGVASMRGANLGGANLDGARLRPEVMQGCWFLHASGIGPATAARLRAAGAILTEADAPAAVDPEIVRGLEVQLAQDPGLEPAERRAALLESLRGLIAARALSGR